MSHLNQTSSEESILLTRGYKLVYLADFKQDETNRNNSLACKIIDTASAPKEFVKRFLPRELDILVKLNHPHIVHVHSIFQRRSKYFIFMRFAENGDLLEFITRNGAVSESQARVWFRQLALGLQYLHEMEIAHRDVKCENVLLTSNYNVKLADFGFARYMIDSRGKRVMSDTYCGSLSYAAPEILRGHPYNPKISDIWSLGVVLYILLNKAMPFDESNLKRLYELQLARKWRFRSKVVNNLSEHVKKLASSMLEPDVHRRWRLDQIVQSEWIAMDPRLLMLTPPEQTALNNAIEERKKHEEKIIAKREPVQMESAKRLESEKKENRNIVKDKTQKSEVTVLKDVGQMTVSTTMTIGGQLQNNALPAT
ncbi:testis-specific serine/threonine-protein kinase 1-like isoform X2 [Pseudomyrmex gracilis]|uniref:testis-specific serine/threonine-protein kinase 1-like isoform X2 n=1 Tax=Pseudomyrmex gracilis TaxID=219809 RepID=UPI000994E43D|nr:testis-specific serine/threonine-protein kinase 1-like isoform X2 [Pseudomyrmex gracilis]